MPNRSKIRAIIVIHSKVGVASSQPDPQRAMEMVNRNNVLRGKIDGQPMIIYLIKGIEELMIRSLKAATLVESHNS